MFKISNHQYCKLLTVNSFSFMKQNVHSINELKTDKKEEIYLHGYK